MANASLSWMLEIDRFLTALHQQRQFAIFQQATFKDLALLRDTK
jgi:hypothetical protein